MSQTFLNRRTESSYGLYSVLRKLFDYFLLPLSGFDTMFIGNSFYNFYVLSICWKPLIKNVIHLSFDSRRDILAYLLVGYSKRDRFVQPSYDRKAFCGNQVYRENQVGQC